MSKKILLPTLAFAFILSSCAAPGQNISASSKVMSESSVSGSVSEPSSTVTTPQTPTSENLSVIYTVNVQANTDISFTADGKIIQPEENAKQVLSDVLTGEERYKIHVKTQDTGKDDKFGAPITSTTTALYDLNDNLLYDYGDFTYDSAFGNLLIRKQHQGAWASIDSVPTDYFSELWDPATNKSVLANVFSVKVLNKDAPIIAAIDVFNTLLCTIDANANVLNTYQNGNRAYINKDHIIVSDLSWDDYESKEHNFLLDEQLKTLASENYISWNGQNILLFSNDNSTGLMDNDGKKYFSTETSAGQSIDFSDGEMLVICDGNNKYSLVNLKNEQLSDNYDQIEPLCRDKWNKSESAALFVARSGTKLDILDKQGTVTKSRQVNDLDRIYETNENYIVFATTDGFVGIIDAELNKKIAPTKYSNIYQSKDYHKDGTVSKNDLFLASYYSRKMSNGEPDYSSMRYDLFDAQLNKITDAVTSIGTVTQHKIAVVRGFSAGIIDWQGNWISKTSIFSTTSDERRLELI